MGGIALGKGVTSSGLLEVLDDIIRNIIEGRTLYEVVMVLSVIVLVSRKRHRCTALGAIFIVLVGHLDIYQSHHRQCAPRANCQGGWEQDARSTRDASYLPHRSDLLDWYGHACVWIPQSTSVCVVTFISLSFVHNELFAVMK